MLAILQKETISIVSNPARHRMLMPARALMFAGTGSDVGKSLMVAGLARFFFRRGLRVRPFKPQNMSNNAAVTVDGGEIGRAQALQARAAGISPTIDMNPILLKPETDTGAQVIVQGRVLARLSAFEYHGLKRRLMTAVLDSFGRLCDEADLVLIEGAGSASEINLRENDLANFGFARAANVPVVMVGDIDRGGVIASLVGTKAVIAKEDADLVRGFIINKFRGDPALFTKGMTSISEATGWHPLGLVPYFDHARRLPPEDSLSLETGGRAFDSSNNRPQIVVLCYPRISNFDDLDPLKLEPGVEVVFLEPGKPIPGSAKLVILPGSKATIADLHSLRVNGWDTDLRAHVRRGGRVLGICGGYQMLGQHIADPKGSEGVRGTVDGLGYLAVSTLLDGDKRLTEVQGFTADGAVPISGYEMHIGQTTGADCGTPMLRFSDGRVDGATIENGRISGCYVHGIFSNDRYRHYVLGLLSATPSDMNYDDLVERTLDELAAHIGDNVDCDELLRMARPPTIKQSE